MTMPQDIKNADLPLPNVYFASVTSAISGDTHHLYVAADFSLAAMRKVARLCADRYGFRPYRGNSVVRLRRFRLLDYLQTPQAIDAAINNAHHLGEQDTIEALNRRPAEVARLLEPHAEVINFDEVYDRLAEEICQAGLACA